ncbi:Asp-tRNA(Asn)/Glu-tRNA(Gln) amidotransferase subunit GatA [Candidatus Peregrinibacteria bacterium]|nr:Asp-tRNA(Asn)/Glu-tRNA(Gln) amidotransferase subunit GatA [Candidatus Peregrinibacteria bacterium]
MEQLCYLGIRDIHEGLTQKQFSAVELVSSFFSHIHDFNPSLNAFITLTEKQALESAVKIDEKIARSHGLNLLEGVPYCLKDLFCTLGIQTTAGSKILEGFLPPYDATSVKRLKAAGGILLGKNTEDEFGHGSSSENTGFSVPRNPWDKKRVAGGSSGGSAVSVASGFSVFALGTDTGGSVRQPASLSGCVGLKPTYGRISRYGVIAMASSLDTVGILARSAEDVAFVLQILAGKDRYDSTLPDVSVPDYGAYLSQDVHGLKVGVPEEYFGEGLEDGVRKAVEQGIDVLKKLGMEVKPVHLPHTKYGVAAYYIICPSEVSANMARYDGIKYGSTAKDAETLMDVYLESRSRGFHPEVKRRIMIGTYALSSGYYDAYYLKAQKIRTLVKQDFEKAFEEVDILAAPVSPTVAFKIGEKTDNPLAMYLNDSLTIPANLAGICALSLPCGFSEGLPVGFQLLGPQFGEDRILQVAHAFQKVTDFHLQHP